MTALPKNSSGRPHHSLLTARLNAGIGRSGNVVIRIRKHMNRLSSLGKTVKTLQLRSVFIRPGIQRLWYLIGGLVPTFLPAIAYMSKCTLKSALCPNRLATWNYAFITCCFNSIITYFLEFTLTCNWWYLCCLTATSIVFCSPVGQDGWIKHIPRERVTRHAWRTVIVTQAQLILMTAYGFR